MEQQKVDRRVRKTKKQLSSALTSLMMQKSVGDITVREIAEAADVNRGTFYAHYRDVSDLLSQLEESIFIRLEEISISSAEQEATEEALYRYFVEILSLCADRADVYRAVICRNNDLDFQQRLFETLKQQYVHSYLLRICRADAKVVDLYSSFIVQGMLSIVKDWMNSGLKESPEQMASYGCKFVLRGAMDLR